MGRSRTMLALLAAVGGMLIAAQTALATTHSNSSSIEIRDKVAGDATSGRANPYPAEIAVAGMVGEITDVDVTLTGLTHTNLNDVGVLLESPSGDRILLMNEIGPLSGATGVTGIDLTFDDENATAYLADDAVPASGSYRPTNQQEDGGLDSFPTPGPGTAYENPGPALGGAATLETFDGADANGTWRLFVMDFLPGDTGQIAGGWSLEIETTGGQVDTTPPDTRILTGPTGTIAQGTAEFTFDAPVLEPGLLFQCRMDGAAWSLCTSPASYSGLAEASHTFEVRALDALLNADPTPATRTFAVDLPDPPPPAPPPAAPPAGDGGGGGGDIEPPTVTITKVKVNHAKRTASVRFAGSDGGGGLSFSCRIDGKKGKPCSSPAKFKRLRPGKHKVQVTAVDASGNRSAPATKRFKVKRS